MKKAFLDSLAPLFPRGISAEQRAGLETILSAAYEEPLKHKAYILATAYHETGATMQPVREAFGKSDEQSVARLESAWQKGQLRWVRTPYWRRDRDGKSWYGRGYVQLTFKDNYARMGKRLGVDLVTDPDVAMQPTLSARILVVGMREGLFTGRKMADFDNYRDMRRVVNGTDRADLIADHAEVFEAALRAAETAEPEKPAEAPRRGGLRGILNAISGAK